MLKSLQWPNGYSKCQTIFLVWDTTHQVTCPFQNIRSRSWAPGNEFLTKHCELKQQFCCSSPSVCTTPAIPAYSSLKNTMYLVRYRSHSKAQLLVQLLIASNYYNYAFLKVTSNREISLISRPAGSILPHTSSVSPAAITRRPEFLSFYLLLISWGFVHLSFTGLFLM